MDAKAKRGDYRLETSIRSEKNLLGITLKGNGDIARIAPTVSSLAVPWHRQHLEHRVTHLLVRVTLRGCNEPVRRRLSSRLFAAEKIVLPADLLVLRTAGD